MTTMLLGVLAIAALFAVFGLTHRRRCDGACPGCGADCSHWGAPADRRGWEVHRGGR